MEADKHTTIDELKQHVTAFYKARSSMSDYNNEPLFTEMGLVLEASEVLEAAKYGLEIKEELVDVLTFLLALAVTNNIDLTTELLAKLELNATRFPKENFIGTAEDFPRQYMEQKKRNKER